MADEIIDDYMSSLGDLTFNSKPMINSLTMIAGESLNHAGSIVRVIEQHLKQTEPDKMLPVMYLIDSIIKNINRGSYQELFAKNLVKTFCGVFEKVDEKTRQALFKLRQTWPSIFSNSKMYALDTAVQQLDPAWPITATPPEAKPKDIHVNPKFLKQRQDEEMERQRKAAEEAEKLAMMEEEKRKEEMTAHALMQQQLMEKQQELLRLQQQKLEMELLEAKARIDQQKRELEMKERQLQLEAEKKAKARIEEEERLLKVKQEQERAAALRREQEKAEALKKQLEARALLIKQKAAANKKEADIKAALASSSVSQDAVKDPRLNRDASKNVHKDVSKEVSRDPRLKSQQERTRPSTITPAQGAKVVTPAARMDYDEEDPEQGSNETPQEKEDATGNKSKSRSTKREPSNKRHSSGRETSKGSSEKSSDSRKSSFSKKARGSRTYRNKRQSESPEINKDSKRSRSRSPHQINLSKEDEKKFEKSSSKDRDRRKGRDRKSDQKRASSKDKDSEEPPTKIQKAEGSIGDNKENKKLPEDLAALFGTEDQDYRSLPPIPKLDTAAAAAAASSSSAMVSPGPNSAGWARFKASRPEEFPFSQPRQSKDVDMRSPPMLQSPPLNLRNSPPFGLSPEQTNIVIPKPMLLDSAEGILKEAQMQLKAGKLSHEQHQELLKQLDQLFKLQSLKQQLRQNAADENTQKMMAAQKAYDEHTLKIRETMVGIGEKQTRDRRGDLSAQSPLYDDPRERRRGSPSSRSYGNRDRERITGPQREFNRRNSLFSKLGPQRDEDLDLPVWQMPPGELCLPYDMLEHYVPSHDPRWYSPSDGPEMTHEVVIDGRGWELPYSNKPRPIRLGPQVIMVKANPYTKEVTINDQVYYRVGDPVRNIILFGASHSISYRGPLKKLWIANFLYEVPADSPPTKIMIDENEHDLSIDSVDNTIIVDGHIVCGYGETAEKTNSIVISGTQYDISFSPPARQILIDGTLCELEFSSKHPCIYIKGKPHGIRFDGPPRNVIINGKPWTINVDRPRKIRFESRRVHIIGFGGPGHEVIIDGKWYEVKFGGPEKSIQLGRRIITVKLPGPPPEVKILGELVEDPMMVNKLAGGYRIDPSFAIDTTVRFNPNNSKNFHQKGGPPNQGEWYPQPPWAGGGMRPERFGKRNPGFMNQRGMWPDQGFNNFQNQGRFRRDGGPRGPRMTNAPFHGNMPFNDNQRFPGPNNMPFGPKGHVPFDPMMNQYGSMNDNMGPPMGDMGPPMGDNMAPNAYPPGPSNMPNMQPFQGNTMQKNFSEGMDEESANDQPLQRQIDVNDLFSKLLQFGIINQEDSNQGSPQPESQQTAEQAPQQAGQTAQLPAPNPASNIAGSATSVLQLINSVRKEPAKKEEVIEPVPDLTDLSTDKLKQEYKGVIQKLYSGIQCSSCGVRFIAEDTAKYREHLDWHFKQNKRDKAEVKVTKYRRWYFTMLQWIQFEEITDYDDKAQSVYFEKITNTQGAAVEGSATPTLLEEETITSCPIAGDEADDVCDICGDPFEQFWSEESEAWHLKDAIRADGKTYHPVCYEDFRETSMMDTTDREEPSRIVATDETSQDSLMEPADKAEEKENTATDNAEKLESTDAIPADVSKASESPATVPQEAIASPSPAVASPSQKPASPSQESESPEKPDVPSEKVPENGVNNAEIEANIVVDTASDGEAMINKAEESEASVITDSPHEREDSPGPSTDHISSENTAPIDSIENINTAPIDSIENTEQNETNIGQSSNKKTTEEDEVDDANANDGNDSDPELMLSIEPLASPKTPLQDEPMTPPGSPVSRQSQNASPIVTRLSLLHKEALTKDPMAIVTQHLKLEGTSEKSQSARVSPVTAADVVSQSASAPTSKTSSPVAQVKEEKAEEDVGQPISSVLGVFTRSRAFRR